MDLFRYYTLENDAAGIDLWSSNENILNDTFAGCGDGIYLGWSSGNVIIGGEEEQTQRWAIILESSESNAISENEINMTHTGIYLFYLGATL
jgi:parallel beta-helix repeat protein